jgi:YD repeat-containing protein
MSRVTSGVSEGTMYNYDDGEQMTRLVYSEDAAAQYTKIYGYDTAGRTTRVTKQGNGITTVVHTYDWDAADRLTRALPVTACDTAMGRSVGSSPGGPRPSASRWSDRIRDPRRPRFAAGCPGRWARRPGTDLGPPT